MNNDQATTSINSWAPPSVTIIDLKETAVSPGGSAYDWTQGGTGKSFP